jgi:APA family basic amino acid/polyamine antiporter
MKFLLIIFILVLGFKTASGSPKIFLPSSTGFKELLHPSAGVALIFCFYAYSGWNSTTYMAGDVESAQKTVGRSLIIGTLIVILIYLLTNAVFLMAAPIQELKGVINVGHVAAMHLFGQQGAVLMSSCIIVGLIAGVSGMIWVGPSIAQMMGKDLPSLSWLSPVTSSGIPLRAVLLQYVLVMILISTASFKFILIVSQFPLIICELLGVLGVLVLRYRKKRAINQESKKGSASQKDVLFRCPFFPLPQIIFAVISLTALVYAMITNPTEGMIGIAIIIVCLAAYPILDRKAEVL